MSLDVTLSVSYSFNGLYFSFVLPKHSYFYDGPFYTGFGLNGEAEL